jgi:hypothetical protein
MGGLMACPIGKCGIMNILISFKKVKNMFTSSVLQWLLAANSIAKTVAEVAPTSSAAAVINTVESKVPMAIQMLTGIGAAIGATSPSAQPLVAAVLSQVTSSDTLAQAVIHGLLATVEHMEPGHAISLVKTILVKVFPVEAPIISVILDAIITNQEASAAIVNHVTGLVRTHTLPSTVSTIAPATPAPATDATTVHTPVSGGGDSD